MWIGVVLTLGLSITSQAQTPKTCWESMLGITPGLSADFGCVKNAAGFQISLLCSEDGIAFKQTFQSYMNERQQYEAALIAYGKWRKENPGGETPVEIQSSLAKEMTLWDLLYNRETIEAQLEVIAQLSAACPLP